MSVLRSIWKELSTAQRFEGDWYAWATNQIGHIGLGIFMTWLAGLVMFLAVGELPYRVTLFFMLTGAYLFFELRAQRWAGWDTIEDTLFFCAYGVGGTLFSFREFSPGEPGVVFDLLTPLPFFAAVILHLAFGVFLRVRRSRA